MASMPSRDSAEADRLWESACGKERWRGTMEYLGTNLCKVSDSDLWQLRADARKSLVDYVRKLHVRQLAGRGVSPEEIAQGSEAA